MMRIAGWSWLWLIVCCLSAAIGCLRSSAPTAAAPQPPLTEPETPAATSGGDEAPAVVSQSSDAPTAELSSATEVKQVTLSEPPQPESKERILLLAPNGPLIVDFILTIGGRPHTEALARLVDEVLKLADTDGDGRTTWKELCACERIKYGQFGNLAIDGDNSEKQIIERYDIARDGIVDRSELPRFLTRNAGGSRPFSIRGTFNNRSGNRKAAPTWHVLDADGNGVIDAEERKLAAARLAARDTDDDEIVTTVELNPRLQTPDPDMAMADRRRRGPDAARLLGEHADWISIQRSLEQEYGGSRTLRGDNSPFSVQVFDQLDANHDGRLIHDELKRLNDVPAQVVLEVAFGSADDAAGAEQSPLTDEEDGKERKDRPRNLARLRLRRTPSDLPGNSPVAMERQGRLTISLGSSVFTLATNDTVSRADFGAQTKQALSMLDQNNDGYLEASEVPESLRGQIGRFEAVDADGDGKAYPHEIEAFLAQQQAGLRAQIHARVSDAEDLLFLALDTNQDQRLDSRETQHAAERLKELDANGDGELTADELPEALLIVLARGSIENPETTFAAPPLVSTADRKAPRWFTAMDANNDGVISPREFLGTAKQFERLDRDQSKLLELAEIDANK